MTLIEKIKSRCIIEGDCWEWQGAFQSCGSSPMMNIKDPVTGKRKVQTVRRLILAERYVDKPHLLKGKFASYSCGNPKCVYPGTLLKIQDLIKELNT
jgi:hypothetical protein